ncbi:VanZ family protein [bacterium]|nr:VanZ family protein [bacterium]
MCKWSIQKNRILVFSSVYVVYLLIVTLSPFEFSSSWLRKLIDSDISVILKSIFSLTIRDMMQNILLFVPLGLFLFRFLSVRQSRQIKTKFAIPMTWGLILSGAIEVTQLFLDRTPSVVDLVMNTGGLCIGFYGAEKIISAWRRVLSQLNHRIQTIFHFSIVICYGLLFAGLLLLPTRINHLRDWNETYSLCIGNEATRDRPWNGKLFLVALYDRALHLSEIQSLYRLGIEGNQIDIRTLHHNVIALYIFQENVGDTIRDVSALENPLHLIMDGARFLNGGAGIQIEEGLLKSMVPGKKIADAMGKTSQITVEVWMETDDLVQTGPARIVSLSENPDRRNFTLGQAGHDIHFRVSTPQTGPNGSRINLVGKDVLNDLEMHHCVAIFNHGLERLIVDGSSVCGTVRGDIDYLPDLLGMGRNPTAKGAFCFAFVFPLGFLTFGLFRKNRLIFALIMAMGWIVLIQFVYFFKFGQPFEFGFFLISFFIVLAGCSVGNLFAKYRQRYLNHSNHSLFVN